jgi:hypothetical protein
VVISDLLDIPVQCKHAVLEISLSGNMMPFQAKSDDYMYMEGLLFLNVGFFYGNILFVTDLCLKS